MFRKVKEYLAGREMLRNLTVLTGGTVIAQAIPILITPILSRLYSPDEFGVWALYLSFVMFLSVLSTGRYQFAVMLPKENREAINILALSFYLLVGFCLLAEGLILIFFQQLQALESVAKIGYWIYFLPLSILLVSSISILNIWNTRSKLFKNIVASKVTQTSTTSVVNIGVGLAKNRKSISDIFADFGDTTSTTKPAGSKASGAAGLIGGTIAGQFVGAIVLLYKFLRHSRGYLSQINKKKIRSSAGKYRDFPAVNVLHATIDNIQYAGVSILIVQFFNAYILGLYSYAYRIVQAPLGIITSSYSQVFFQRSAELHAHGQSINPLYKKTLRVFFLLGLPVFLVLAIFGPQIFAFVFGEEWRESGFYVQLLAPWFFMNFLISPMGQIPIILQKQRQVFLLSIIGNALILLSLIVGSKYFESIRISFLLISITQTLYYGYMLIWFNRLTKNQPPHSTTTS